jgi:hypothetical protein
VGIDVLGWNGCTGGDIESPDELVDYVKLVAHRNAVDASVPEPERANVTISGANERIAYPELVETLKIMESRAGSCAECFRENAACYAYITYPIDAECEEMLFNFFLVSAATENSPADQIARDYLSSRWSEHWLDVREGDSRLLERDAPLTGKLPRGGDVDSTTVLELLFSSLDRIETVTAFGLVWNDFATYAAGRSSRKDGSVQEVLALPALYRHTFTHAAAGAQECQVIFYA